MSVTFSGIASGIDSASLIDSLVASAKVPMNRLQTQKTEFNSQSKKLSDIKTKLTTLQTAAKALDSKGEALGNKTTSSDEKVMKATALGGASMGSFKVEVSSVAQSERTYSNAFASDGEVGVTGTGKLTIKVGAADAIEIEVDTQDTLATIANKINAAGAQVSAGIFNDGTSFRLQVTGTQSGEKNAITFTEGTGLSLGLSNPLNEKQVASDAVVTVDGLPVKSASNTIAGAVPGVTLTVVDKGTSVIQVDRDDESLKAKLQTFTDAYNDVMKTLNAEFTYTGAKKGNDSLASDSTLKTLQGSLRGLASRVTGNGDSKMTSLGSIGLNLQRDGTLLLDGTKYSKAIAADYEGVSSLLAGRTDGAGLMTAFSNGLDQYARSDGTLKTRIDNLAARNKRIDAQVANMQLRLDKYQETLQRQYSALESTMGNLQSQGNALSSILL